MGIQFISISHWLVRNRLFVVSLVCLGVVLAALAGPAGAVTPQIAGGLSHTVVLKYDGTLWAWGWNGRGQLGVGGYTDKTVPTQIGADTGWAAVAAGNVHTLALKTNGSLWAWGWNSDGQLGDGTRMGKTVPTPIGTDTDWAAVAAGYVHTLALKTNGSLWAWGHNYYGQLGDGTTMYKTVPTRIGTDTDWAAIAGGGLHTLALKSDGSLWAWGNNDYGQLGDGTTMYKTVPTRIGTDTDWTVITAGSYHSLALKTDGSLWAWGRNANGQLGDGTTMFKAVPTQIGADTDWTAVAAGWHHTLALKSDGSLWAWGRNADGQLGDGTSGNHKTVPSRIGTDTDWATVAAGWDHSLALKTDGSLWAWGRNANGQLGDGTTISKSTPILVPLNLGTPNQPPVPDAGAYQAVVEGDTVLLDGTASSDPDGDPLAYLWTITSTPVGSAAFLSDPASPTPTFTADLPGDYSIDLVVNDGYVDSDPDSVFIIALTYQDAAEEIAEETIEIINSLPPDAFANPNRVIPLTDKINEVVQMIEDGLYLDARDKLLHDILPKTDGCATQGTPDRNDWIDNCEDQAVVYPLVLDMIDLLNNLL